MYKFVKNGVNIGYSVLFALFSVYMIKNFVVNGSILRVVAGSFAMVCLVLCYSFVLKKLSEKAGNIFRLSLFGVLFLCQFYLFWKTFIPFGWDTVPVRDVGCMGFTDMLYFAKCPNNTMAAMIMRRWVLLLSPLGFVSPLRKLVMLNILTVDLSVLFGYLTLKRLYGTKIADIYILPAVFLISFSPWVAVHYTDTLAVLFPVLCMYLLVLYTQAEGNKKKNKYLFLMGCIAVFTAYIKLTIVIFLIAFVLAVLINEGIKKDKNFVRNYGAVVIGALVGLAVAKGILIYPQTLINRQVPDVKARGFYYFLETGLSSYGKGIWSADAYNFANDHIYDDDYEQVARQRIINIVKGYGAAKLTSHFYKKIIWSGTDGTFSYAGEGDFYHEGQSDVSTLRGKLQCYIYHYTPFYQNILSPWLNGIWLLSCVFSALSIFSKSKEDDAIFISKFSIGGLFLFLMIFENRARYIFLYAPVMLAISASAFVKEKNK